MGTGHGWRLLGAWTGRAPAVGALTPEAEPPAPPRPAEPPPEPAEARDVGRLLAEVGTGLWRMRRKLAALEGGEAPGGLTALSRHLESVWDSLTEAGVDVRDHTGEAFDSGLALRALAFQPTPGLDRETVVETVRPSVFFGNRRVQAGEVIVGTPPPPIEPAPVEPPPETSPASGDGASPTAPTPQTPITGNP